MPNFRIEDITHTPLRYQGDIIEESVKEVVDVSNTDIPQNPTLETAIAFYESHSTAGHYASLYKSTASWLRKLLSKSKTEVGE